MTSRRALLRHLWSMLQTRAEAAGLVLSLQRSALGRGVAWYAIAGITAIALMIALLLLVALGTPEEYRVAALGGLSLALLAATIFSAMHAKSQMSRDTALIADFTTGLRLDLAMVNLALKDPETEDEDKLAQREQAKYKVREAAAEKAAAPSTAEGTDHPAPDGPSMGAATAAMHAATPKLSEAELRSRPMMPPAAMAAASPAPGAFPLDEIRPPHRNGADSPQQADDTRRQHGTT